MFKYSLIVSVFSNLIGLTLSQGRELCAGKSGVIRFSQADLSEGNVSGIIRWSRQLKGQSSSVEFALYNLENDKLQSNLPGDHSAVSREDIINLKFMVLEKNDEGNYSVSFVVDKGPNTKVSKLAKKNVMVKDPCINETEDAAMKCTNVTCYTSRGGYLQYKGENLTSLMASVCDTTNSGVYKCCSPTSQCENITATDPETRKRRESNKRNDLTIWLPVAVILGVLIALAIGVAVYFLKRRKANDERTPNGDEKLKLNDVGDKNEV